MKKLCIIGLGTMGTSIFDALSSKKLFNVRGCDRGDDVNAACADSDIIVIAVKPQGFSELANEIRTDMSGKLIVSIMAGISVENISKSLPAKNVVRIMPNLPIKVGAGFSGWFAADGVSEEDKEDIRILLNSIGEELELKEENQIDSITPISASGPAYFAYLVEALEHAALRSGFDLVSARKMAKATFVGTAELMKQESLSAGNLIEKVASKGGTTEVAIEHMDYHKMDEIVVEAVIAAQKRAKELNN